jgi:hypothetical protein
MLLRQGSIRVLRCAALSAFLGLSVLPVPLSAQTMQAPNSRVIIDLPAGFVASKQFSGFMNEKMGASIVVVEFPPEAYSQMVLGMTPDALAARGMQKAVIGKLDTRTGDHVYIRAEQAAGGMAVQKFMLIVKEPDATVLVTANVPDLAISGGRVKTDAIEAALASVRLAAEITPAKPAFTVDDLGPFKEAATLAGFTKIYSLDGTMTKTPEAAYRPVLLIAPSLDKRPVGQLEAFSARAVQSLASFTVDVLQPPRRLKVGGLDAVEQEAVGQDTALGKPLSVYQLIVLLPGGGYIRLVGTAPTPDMAALRPVYVKIGQGLRPAG